MQTVFFSQLIIKFPKACKIHNISLHVCIVFNLVELRQAGAFSVAIYNTPVALNSTLHTGT